MARRKGTESDAPSGDGGSPERESSPASKPTAPALILGVGASAGGLEPMTQLLAALPADRGVAVVVVQHLDPTHGSHLPEILGRSTRMPVLPAQDGMRVEAGRVYVIPPTAGLTIAGGVLALSPREAGRGDPHTIDNFFRSLAADRGPSAIGVILSGTAHDGTTGLGEIRAAGGITFAQDASARHDSMPRSAVDAGCVDFVLPPGDIAREVARIAADPQLRGREARPDADEAFSPELERVLGLLRDAKGVDFSRYRRSTLQRRVARRALLRRAKDLGEYLKDLEAHPAELDALHQDILISVTSFFRDPEAFAALQEKVFPRLLERRPRDELVRIWVLGCSSGEEACSLAIAFTEACEALKRPVSLQVFATDVNPAAVEKARAGVYPRSIEGEVSPERLRRFFVETERGYRIAKSIRDKCIFAVHDALAAPPFSNIDLVSCRNVLIYLEPVLQQRLLPLLHYALRPGGILWLGNSETTGASREGFDTEDARHKIYSRKSGQHARAHLLPRTGVDPVRPAGFVLPPPRAATTDGHEVQKEADRALLKRFAPSGVLVNEALDVLQFRGDTGPFLSPAAGKASLNLVKLLREGLLVPVRAALEKARQAKTAVRQDAVQVRGEGGFLEVSVEVLPLEANGEQAFLVLFEESSDSALRRARARAQTEAARAQPPRRAGDDATEIARLVEELDATRDYLQSVIEQQDGVNEDLQAANEEVQSANEELQSINEELETSKEEIQSSNEELATLNEELHNRNRELNELNNDLVNLLASVQVAIVMLDAKLHVRRYTPVAEAVLGLGPADIGRRLADARLRIVVPDLVPLLTEVIDTLTTREREVRDPDGRWFSVRMRPYRTVDGRIDGAVLLFLDVDAMKRQQELVRQQELLRRQQELLDHAYEPIFIYAYPGGEILYWNRGAQETYGHTREQALGQSAFHLLSTSPEPKKLLAVLESTGSWTGELVHRCRDGSHVQVESRMVRVADPVGGQAVVVTDRDITRRKRIEDDLRRRADDLLDADRRRNEFLALLAHELRNPLAALSNTVSLIKTAGADAALLEHAQEATGRQVRRMSRLVNDLLDVARIMRNHINLEKEVLDLCALARRALEVSRERCDERKQRISHTVPSTPIFVEADPVRLEQILDNLLDNACKFTHEGGHVEVVVDRERDATIGPCAVLRVRDNGIGIDAAMQARIFDLFVQVDASAGRTAAGLGIGLSLVRRLVELHGGRVELRSDGLGRGSEFIIRLPLVEAPVKAPAPNKESPRPAPGIARRVLLVDDNVDAAESLAFLMRREGHDVRVVTDPKQAEAIAEDFQPDIGVLDIGMPGLDGYELARRLRRRLTRRPLRLLALTGYGRMEDQRRSQEAGFDHHLTKPVEVDRILRLVAGAPAQA